MTLKVAILNDFEVVVRGLQSMLISFEPRLQVVELTTDTAVLREVDLLLYDTFSRTQVDEPEIDEVLADAHGMVVVYSWNTHPELVETALAKGCRGYLSKSLSAPDLVNALERIAAGEVVVSDAPPETEDGALIDEPALWAHGDWPGRDVGLTAREAEVLSLIALGLTNIEIAHRSYLSINSVKSYIRSAYRRIGVTRRSQAVRWAHEHRLMPDQVRVLPPAPPGA